MEDKVIDFDAPYQRHAQQMLYAQTSPWASTRVSALLQILQVCCSLHAAG